MTKSKLSFIGMFKGLRKNKDMKVKTKHSTRCLKENEQIQRRRQRILNFSRKKEQIFFPTKSVSPPMEDNFSMIINSFTIFVSFKKKKYKHRELKVYLNGEQEK